MRRAQASLTACALVALLAVPLAQAQTAKPVESPATEANQARLIQQQRATAAFREMQQATFEAKLAEQDVVNTQEALNATQARADLLRKELDKATQARDAAKTKEAAARKRYDEALDAVPR